MGGEIAKAQEADPPVKSSGRLTAKQARVAFPLPLQQDGGVQRRTFQSQLGKTQTSCFSEAPPPSPPSEQGSEKQRRRKRRSYD
uniref:Uncharacterized protein n=1 Tax=Knipowitschia caucasica TaxID=637954 RepID=A0AAV2LLT4_KNICA